MARRIKRLVVFGDSMSDIGNMQWSAVGVFARIFGMMRVNEVGRYSDRRNWTDFLWEWAGGQRLIFLDQGVSLERSKNHRSLGPHSSIGAPRKDNIISYANYAEGGAMGASDKPFTGVGYFKDQHKRYYFDRKTDPVFGFALHIVWFGLNDLVTNERPAKDMGRVAEEIWRYCDATQRDEPNTTHFLFINMPNPKAAVRFMGLQETNQVKEYEKGALAFNSELEKAVQLLRSPKFVGVTTKDPVPRADLVDVYSTFEQIDQRPEDFGLTKGAQPRGVKVLYAKDEMSHANYTTTSDKAHPTEAVHRIIAKLVAAKILENFDLGVLRDTMQDIR